MNLVRRQWLVRSDLQDATLLPWQDASEEERRGALPAWSAAFHVDAWFPRGPGESCFSLPMLCEVTHELRLSFSARHTTPFERMKEEVREALLNGRLLAVPRARIKLAPAHKTEPPPVPKRTPTQRPEYELPIEVLCELTSHPMPKVPFLVRDADRKVLDRGETDETGHALAIVPSGSGCEVVLLPNRVETLELALHDANGAALAGIELAIVDASGQRQTLQSDDRGFARATRVATGTAKIIVGAQTVEIHIDSGVQRAELIVPHVFATTDDPDEFAALDANEVA